MGNIPILMATVVGMSWWAASTYATSTTRLEAPSTKSTLFVWDFDWTVINCNSDEYIPAQFLPEEELKSGFRQLIKATDGDWHACVEGMVDRAMEQGGADQGQILQAAAQMPYLTPVKQALNQIHACGTSQMILSDGNTLFIGAFLKETKLQDHFDAGVVSNLGSWNDQGRLKVVHQSHQYGGHDCDRCSDNLCKTQALTKTLQRIKGERPRIVYVGDGGNDACPVLKVLQEGDIMLARAGKRRTCANERKGAETDQQATSNTEEGSNFGILPALQNAKAQHLAPTCQVWEWQTGEELKGFVEKILEDGQ